MNTRSLRTARTKFNVFSSWENILTGFILLTGFLLRLRQYLTGRSLWLDEAMLALNIVNRDFGELFKPLDYDQGAPIGFTLVEKTFSLVFGRNELSLRLFPFLVGLVSLWMFYLLLKQSTRGVGLWVGLALFAFNPRLIYYSSEVKQYIVDVAVTIGLLLLAAPLFNTQPRKRDFLWVTAAGLIALWFSHPALFVLAGIGLALVIIHLRRSDYSSLRFIIGMGIVWTLNIGFLYLLILKDLQQNTLMREYWQGTFVPFPPWSDAGWYIKSLRENIAEQFEIWYAVPLVLALMLIGWAAFLYYKQEVAIVFACILLVTLTASTLQLYPVFERLILFLIPIGLVLTGKAVEVLYQQMQRYGTLSVLSVLLIGGYLIYGPFTTSLRYFIEPKYFEHIRPTMSFLQESWKDGDAMFISYGAVPAFEFYAPMYELTSVSYLSSQWEDYKNPDAILERLSSLKGHHRVWVLMSHIYEKGDFNEKDFLIAYLDQLGDKKREFREPGTSVYLYLYDLAE